MPSKKASLINFRQPQPPSSPASQVPDLDDFVNRDPNIPTPSLPAMPMPEAEPDLGPEAVAAKPATEPERMKVSTIMNKKLHMALKSRAALVQKKLQYLIEDALEAYMDRHDPEWRTRE